MKNIPYLLLTLVVLLLITAACSSNKTVEIPPPPPPSPLQLAHAYADSGATAFTAEDYLSAIKYFSQARDYYTQAAPTATPTDSIEVNIERIDLNIALSYVNQGNEDASLGLYDDALTTYEKAANIYKSLKPITIKPEERDDYLSKLYRNMAITAQNAKQYERALQYYDMVLTYEPGNEEILNIKYHILKDDIKDQVRAYQVLKDYAEASQDYKAYLILAAAYKDSGDNATAEIYYLKAMELGQNPDVYTRVADFYRETKNYTKSNEILTKLIASTTDKSTLALAYRVMADNYAKLGNTAKKIEAYDNSLKYEESAEIALLLADHWNKQKNWDKVITYATKAINANPSNAAAYLLRGNAYYMKKNYTAAKADLQRIQNDPTYGKSATDILKKIK
ncbi:MAG: tetratricopeptide repeat protein [Candidatus Cloacimonetes bacterium]|jgi:tetratricopeptide (TPR) repeat protein|nr:tetratricopeptide repeat protein [Candidatus Cloacimonadota bacterium]HOD59542.1 hypothetical protein [Candidatus Syntrophosphaera sp.]HQM79609.1 hypothetical protein [Candidatus Syntrophosphaera sp.]